MDMSCPADGQCLEGFLRFGRALASDCGQVVIGRDASVKGPMAFSLLSSGIVSMGCDVRYVGVAPAPTVAVASKGRCGVMLGHSDIVAEMRIWNPDGTMSDGPDMTAETELPSYAHVGGIHVESGALAVHKGNIMRRLGEADCPVVLDCSSDCASLIVPSMLTEMGCDVIAINSQLDGRSAPKGIDEGSLRDLTDIVNANTGEIGIAVNGDGTRIAAVDESGRYVNGEILLALFAQHLDPRKVIVPVTASMMVDDLIGGEVVRVAAGEIPLTASMLSENADFGGTPAGSFVFPGISYCPDGVHASALLSKIAGESRLRELVDSLPTYHKEDVDIRYDGREQDIAKRISESVRSHEYVKLVETDGWRVEMDAGWFLIRFSRKEPVIRITAEARDELYAISLMDIAKNVVSNALK